ncbi:MAG: hypothetical protein ACJ77D_01760 [Chloroflexota bacterium]
MSRRQRIGTRFILASTLVGLGLTAPTLTRAATTVDLDQWASTDKAWQNGNLNGNNSRYPEGGIVPFRLALEGLKAGSHAIHIDYDFTAGGHKAYDFLATWNVTNAAGKACTPSGGAISSMCPSLPASSSAAIPSDPFKANGLSVAGAEKYSGAPRRLTIWGGTITSISRPAHSGNVNGNSTADILVRFRSTRSAVLLAWGGHLAQSRYWDTAGGGARDGASLVSGAPWHMRTLQLDGAGNKNQDRSIQPSAIVGELPPQALAPTPRPTPRPPANPAPTPRPPSNPSQPNAPDQRPAAQDPGPLGTVPPTSTAAERPTPPGGVALLYVALFTAGLVAISFRGARAARTRSRPTEPRPPD